MVGGSFGVLSGIARTKTAVLRYTVIKGRTRAHEWHERTDVYGGETGDRTLYRRRSGLGGDISGTSRASVEHSHG